ncbi:MAG: hypothetical protein PUC88_04740 [Clostridia bacterium]|nr:hypothetical protein [Clostridia bacterium]
MSNYCGKCGRELDNITGLCPKCDAKALKKTLASRVESVGKTDTDFDKPKAIKLTRKQKKAIKKANRTLGQKIGDVLFKMFMTVLIVSIIAGTTVGALVYFDVINISAINNLYKSFGIKGGKEENGSDTEYKVTYDDANEYYQSNSEVISKIEARDSKSTTTEAETVKQLKERGFTSCVITTNYDMDGNYFDDKEIGNSSEKHPLYQTYYQTKNNEIWEINLINGTIVANPIYYNIQSDHEAQVIISESDSIMSYDSSTNMFFETIPDESVLIVKNVKELTAEVLENLDYEGIDKL